jgi:hypothetical protein
MTINKQRRRAAAMAAIVATIGASGAGTAIGTPDDQSATVVTFAIIGDTPYGQPQIDNFANDIAQINADPQIRLVVHLGDIKNGSSRCDTSYSETIVDDFSGFKDPLVSCHEFLKLTIDPSADGIFTYDRVHYHNQPGFDGATCPAS